MNGDRAVFILAFFVQSSPEMACTGGNLKEVQVIRIFGPTPAGISIDEIEKLTLEPSPILYTLWCWNKNKCNVYYTFGAGETLHYFCIPSYNDSRGDAVVDGSAIPKARMEKRKNDEEPEEWWVHCDKCEAWQHQICALFSGRRNDCGQADTLVQIVI